METLQSVTDTTAGQTDIMLVTVILLVVLVQIFQTIGMLIANKLDKRK